MNRHLLILDVDETLVFATDELLTHQPDFTVYGYGVYCRPYLQEFLAAVCAEFQVAVWSSAGTDYVQAVVESIFPDPDVLEFVWSAPRCTQQYDSERSEFYWIKNLKKVKRRGFALEQVLMLDDTPQKLERQYGNLLQIQPFEGDTTDTELRDVLPFLNWLRSINNVRMMEKRYWRNWQPK